jgi:hypothetical protein
MKFEVYYPRILWVRLVILFLSLAPGFIIVSLKGRRSLMTLITVAGGLKENHGSTAFFISETRNLEDNPPNEAAPRLKALAASGPQLESSVASARPSIHISIPI